MSAHFPLGNPANPDWFTGDVHMASMEEPTELQAANVTFAVGARTNWHTHQVGQLIIIVEGEGLFQEEGQPARLIQTGETAWAGPGVNHWHGATAESAMSHVVANLKDEQGGFVDWGRPVTDVEFSAADASVR
ncbi:cupin domain-containing protein [Corynebacterium sp. A21]|uniref:cupin domain-containing protein n=1 Tax=Corynebacterium sp. A21 TaxID=3457318 RepID=UPI003FCF4506